MAGLINGDGMSEELMELEIFRLRDGMRLTSYASSHKQGPDEADNLHLPPKINSGFIICTSAGDSASFSPRV